MRALLQRVSRASVSIQGRETAAIGPGLVVLLGIARQDTQEDARYLVDKSLNLRIFADDTDHFNRSALDPRAARLTVSQFTLYAGTPHGRAPERTARQRRAWLKSPPSPAPAGASAPPPRASPGRVAMPSASPT